MEPVIYDENKAGRVTKTSGPRLPLIDQASLYLQYPQGGFTSRIRLRASYCPLAGL
jgi:hypothetical protein